MGVQNETWLRCGVSSGMFDEEYGVDGRQFDGTVFSLFAPADSVDPGEQSMISGESVPGWVRVEVIERKDNLVLVKLPRQTFQDGAYITVTADQLEKRAQRQKV